MLKIGNLNQMQVARRVDFGVYLADTDADTDAPEILMPKRYVPQGLEIDDFISVFVYKDSEDRLIATTEQPKVMVGECAYLQVAAVNRTGAFMDWGLPKDLLVPFGQQAVPMQPGHAYAVYVYLDQKTQRITASSRLHTFLSEQGHGFKCGQAVSLLIVDRSPLGYKAVVDGSHLGLIFHSEAVRPIAIGEQTGGRIKHIRPDGRLDLSLSPNTGVQGGLQAEIVTFLRANGGVSSLTDKTAAEVIFSQFGVSKSRYKKALGALYKNRSIDLGKDQIRLL